MSVAGSDHISDLMHFKERIQSAAELASFMEFVMNSNEFDVLYYGLLVINDLIVNQLFGHRFCKIYNSCLDALMNQFLSEQDELQSHKEMAKYQNSLMKEHLKLTKAIVEYGLQPQ